MVHKNEIVVLLPDELLVQVNQQVGKRFSTRNEFVRSAIRHYLNRLKEEEKDAAAD